MTRFSICPSCGQITPYPDTASQTKRRCTVCGATKVHPMAPDRDTAERLAGTINKFKEEPHK